MSGIDFQFHFRNFDHKGEKIRCHHAGCAMTKWHDDRPCCWKQEIQYGPHGEYDHDVYNPSNFVVNFGEWWPLIKAGLELVKEVTVFMIPPKTPRQFEDILASVFHLEVEAIRKVIQDDGMSDADLEDLLENAEECFEKTCKCIGLTTDRVHQIARDMGLADDNWALLAGPDYWDNIHGDGSGGSPIVGDHGWSIFRGPDGDRKIAVGCFIEDGHFIYPVSRDQSDIDNAFWSSQISGHWSCPACKG